MKPARYALAVGLIVISCSTGQRNDLGTSPNGLAQPSAGPDGASGASAVGDVKQGGGNIEIIRLRMDRQMPSGASIYRQYALPGETYIMLPGETIELWAEWDPNSNYVPSFIPNNPRFTVDWGFGEPNSPDSINCGGCLLKHTYPRAGVYKVTATLSDRAGTTVSRTFFLNSLSSAPTPTPSPSPSLSPTVTLTVACSGERCDGTGHVGTSFGGAGLITGSGISCGNVKYDGDDLTATAASLDTCGPLSFPAGTVVTLTANGTTLCDEIDSWDRACAGVGGGEDTRTGTCTLTLNSNTVVSATFIDSCSALSASAAVKPKK